MAFTHFLAMTSAEFDSAPRPPALAWMACHFSPYSTGLSNLPMELPEGSLLILNDRTPMAEQDPLLICTQIKETLQKFHCSGLLLDFQRPGNTEVTELVSILFRELSLPMAVTPEYLPPGGTVFLPPIPAEQPAENYLAPWKGRDIWLDTALSGTEILLTANGAAYKPLQEPVEAPMADKELFCHYRIDPQPGAVRFSLCRTMEDLILLLEKAQQLGVSAAVGLYQELGKQLFQSQ